jgi:hypothetical protein
MDDEELASASAALNAGGWGFNAFVRACDGTLTIDARRLPTRAPRHPSSTT